MIQNTKRATKQSNLDRDSMYSLQEVLPYVVFTEPRPYVPKKKRKSKDKREPEGRPERLYNGKPVKMDSLRYQTFAKHGTDCVFCGLKGTFFALERHGQGTGNNPKRWHLNLYGINVDKEEVLFTKDHIIPRGRGGKNTLANLQPCCYPCNSLKGCGTSPKNNSNNLCSPARQRKLSRVRSYKGKIQKRLAANKAVRRATYIPKTSSGGPGYMKLVATKKRLIYRLKSLGRLENRLKYS